MRFCPEHDVFKRSQGVYQHEVLVHHADTQANGIVGVANLDGLAIHFDRPAVGLVEAIQHGHQRTFSRTVFAHDAVHRASGNAQVDIGIGGYGTKTLTDTRQPNCNAGWRTGHQNLQALSAM